MAVSWALPAAGPRDNLEDLFRPVPGADVATRCSSVASFISFIAVQNAVFAGLVLGLAMAGCATEKCQRLQGRTILCIASTVV